MNELRKQIDFNNKQINKLNETIKKYYKKDTDIKPYSVDNITNEKDLEEIVKKQLDDIDQLNILVDIYGQDLDIKRQAKIEELKEKESDKDFSNFYRTGIIKINDIEVSVDKFFIRELIDKDNKPILNFVCTDTRLNNDNNIEEYEIKSIHPLKKSKIFYLMYLDKNLFKNNKLIIDNKEKLDIFMNYIKDWTEEKHQMVAETMV